MKEEKDFRFELKAVDADGTFVGLAAVYGNVDLGGDSIDAGAFKRTLADRGGEIKLLWQHNPSLPIGKGRLTDSAAGLQIEGKLALGITAAKDAYEALKAGIVDGLSIGYDAIKAESKAGARHLKEIRLHEVSLVTFPMNTEARVSVVKSEDVYSPEFVKSLSLRLRSVRSLIEQR
jgi:HK97 family phage prohead protease